MGALHLLQLFTRALTGSGVGIIETAPDSDSFGDEAKDKVNSNVHCFAV
jgi:hypothetical protein